MVDHRLGGRSRHLGRGLGPSSPRRATGGFAHRRPDARRFPVGSPDGVDRRPFDLLPRATRAIQEALLESRFEMIRRRYVFPGVLEMNYQAQRRMGVNIYLVDGGTEFALIDVGFLDELPDVLELIRQMNFSLSA